MSVIRPLSDQFTTLICYGNNEYVIGPVVSVSLRVTFRFNQRVLVCSRCVVGDFREGRCAFICDFNNIVFGHRRVVRSFQSEDEGFFLLWTFIACYDFFNRNDQNRIGRIIVVLERYVLYNTAVICPSRFKRTVIIRYDYLDGMLCIIVSITQAVRHPFCDSVVIRAGFGIGHGREGLESDIRDMDLCFFGQRLLKAIRYIFHSGCRDIKEECLFFVRTLISSNIFADRNDNVNRRRSVIVREGNSLNGFTIIGPFSAQYAVRVGYDDFNSVFGAVIGVALCASCFFA